jgi:hypothetical protein
MIDAPGVATILEKEAIRPIQKEAALRGGGCPRFRGTSVAVR